MDQIKKFINFLGVSYPLRTDEERHSFQKSNYVIPKEIMDWFKMYTNDFYTYFCGRDSIGIACSLTAYVKSCQYTEHVIEESEKRICKELKSLIYNMLDEINDLKEHNKCLSQRILSLENKPPLILY